MTAATAPQLDKTKNSDGDLDGKVEFSFKHVLSRIEFTLQAAADFLMRQVPFSGSGNVPLLKGKVPWHWNLPQENMQKIQPPTRK